MELNFLTLVTSILVANALTAMLIYGLARMFKNDLDSAVVASLFLPIGFMVAGVLYLNVS